MALSFTLSAQPYCHFNDAACIIVEDSIFIEESNLQHGPYEVSLLSYSGKQGTVDSIAVMGNISVGLPQVLDRYLRKYPTIKTLVISSGGGSPIVSFELFDVIYSHELTVIIPPTRACLSACADAVIAANDLIIIGQLGFHSIYYTDIDSRNFDDMINEIQIVQTAIINNRLISGLGMQFSFHVAMQRGDFVVFDSTEQWHAVMNDIPVELLTAIRTGDETTEYANNQLNDHILSVQRYDILFSSFDSQLAR